MKEPTQEQIKEFWEWCGFKWITKKQFVHGVLMHGGEWVDGYWESPIKEEENYGHWLKLPTIDPTNLFKYAVPKLDTIELDYDYRQASEGGSSYKLTHSDHIYTATVTLDVRGEFHSTKEDKDPALALFWAIYEVIK